MKQQLQTEKAPGAIGPYSQGIQAGQTVYISGQLPLDAATGRMGETTAEQTTFALNNLEAVLASAGLTLADVVKTTVFMTDLGEFSAMNEVYGQRFTAPYPARSAVQVAALPKGAALEIECIAVRAAD